MSNKGRSNFIGVAYVSNKGRGNFIGVAYVSNKGRGNFSKKQGQE